MLNFYRCSICGNLVVKIEDGGTTPSCCGKQMYTLTPASTDGAIEKHVPVVLISDAAPNGKLVHVSVGSEPHPSQSYHYIAWIAIETNRGIHLHHLNAGDTPEAKFMLCDNEEIINAYAYCNLHGVWVG